MPESTLSRLKQYFSGNGLQIGGFVGMTHAYIANHLNKAGGDGVILTVDCNLTHRGIHDPLHKLDFLVNHYRLNHNSMSVLGLAQNSMSNFSKMGMRFDFILLDGNHELSNVLEEVRLSDRILRHGGRLILDDIDHWDGPRIISKEFPLPNYRRLVLDTRAAVFVKGAATAPNHEN